MRWASSRVRARSTVAPGAAFCSAVVIAEASFSSGSNTRILELSVISFPNRTRAARWLWPWGTFASLRMPASCAMESFFSGDFGLVAEAHRQFAPADLAPLVHRDFVDHEYS